MPYVTKTTEYRELEVDRDALLSIHDAAKVLEMSLPGVIAAINRGELTEVIDTEARYRHQRRRFVLRDEVAAAAARRGLVPETT